MPFRVPTVTDIIRAGAVLGLDLTNAEAHEYLGSMERLIESYKIVDGLSDERPVTPSNRTYFEWPEVGQNLHNAWYVKTNISGANYGKLLGKNVVLKDNICLSGIPMMNGSRLFEGLVPQIDATVVTRLLEQGATITGKATCESFCYSGGSHTSDTGPVLNPWSSKRSAGGSSSGCAALLASQEVDMALGCDQAGSIRIPAAFCGIYGLKPTFGLVPYTGILTSEMSLDHVGPMTATVEDNATLLEVISGPDGLDPRQTINVSQSYTDFLKLPVNGMRIGILREGFGLNNSEKEVDHLVCAAANKFAELGAIVKEISVPMHKISTAIRAPIAVEGGVNTILHNDGSPRHGKDLYIIELLAAGRAWRGSADKLPESLKYIALFGQHVMDTHGTEFYAKAQNITRRLTSAYDQVFKSVDLLLLPTVPMRATLIPPLDASPAVMIQRSHEMMANTAAFTITGHPALSMPCALSEGLPVGMMLVGRHYEEGKIYTAANAFEQNTEWQKVN